MCKAGKAILLSTETVDVFVVEHCLNVVTHCVVITGIVCVETDHSSDMDQLLDLYCT